ncbi:MAG: hypothetical protein R3324_18045, partial [Halobacteriales archaeon]|nr:hypothetical protein [Halobacteriales archaeon]
MGNDRQIAWRRYFSEELRSEVQDLANAYPRERTLTVDAIDLHSFDADLADALFTRPDATLAAAERALRDLYDGFSWVRIRPENYPGLTSVRSLRTGRRSEIVGVEGVVLTTHPIRSKVAMAAFECSSCGHRTARRPRGLEVRTPTHCPSCERVGSVSFDDRNSRFIDVRRVELGDAAAAADAAPDGNNWAVDVCL